MTNYWVFLWKVLYGGRTGAKLIVMTKIKLGKYIKIIAIIKTGHKSHKIMNQMESLENLSNQFS